MEADDRFEVADRVAASKARLAEKLSELGRRVDAMREAARPVKTATQPWVLFGASFAVGFLLGRRPPRHVLPVVSGATLARAARPGILGALAREILLASAAAYARRFVEDRQNLP